MLVLKKLLLPPVRFREQCQMEVRGLEVVDLERLVEAALGLMVVQELLQQDYSKKCQTALWLVTSS
jgi:hypothetical protein